MCEIGSLFMAASILFLAISKRIFFAGSSKWISASINEESKKLSFLEKLGIRFFLSHGIHLQRKQKIPFRRPSMHQETVPPFGRVDRGFLPYSSLVRWQLAGEIRRWQGLCVLQCLLF